MSAVLSPRPRVSTRRAGAVAVLATVTLLAACADGSSDSTGDGTPAAAASAGDAASAAADAGPVTIEHAFGETEVPADPQRVVTWGWGSADAALAMWVTPVAMTYQAYGGDDEGVLPWIREYVEAEGLEMPETLPDTQEAPVEAIAAARPDLILAPYSGLTDAEYEQLSQIAPTVAYPDEPWATPWRETIAIVGQALGRESEAAAIVADIDEQVAAEAAAHPEFADLSVAAVLPTADTFYVYRPADPRVEFLLDLGFEHAESVDSLSSGDESFFYTLSAERLDELDSDVLVGYFGTAEEYDAFVSSPEADLLDQIERGALADIVGTEFVSAVSPPTALSLPWGLEEFVSALSDAASSEAATPAAR